MAIRPVPAQRDRMTGYVYIAIAVSTLGGLIFGYDIGISGGAGGFVAGDLHLGSFLEGAVVSGSTLGGAAAGRGLIGEAMTLAPVDERVAAVFHEYGAAVGRGLAALHTLWQPRMTVIGGSAAVCFPLIRDDLYRALGRSEDYAVDVELRPAVLGDNAGAIGAAVAIAPDRRG